MHTVQGSYSGAETVLRAALGAGDEDVGDSVEAAVTLGCLASALGEQVGFVTSLSTLSMTFA